MYFTNSVNNPKKARIGEILVKKGLVSSREIEAALVEQPASGKKLGEILVAKGVISEVQLKRALQEQYWQNLAASCLFSVGTLISIPQSTVAQLAVKHTISGFIPPIAWIMQENNNTQEKKFKLQLSQEATNIKIWSNSSFWEVSLVSDEAITGSINSKALVKVELLNPDGSPSSVGEIVPAIPVSTLKKGPISIAKGLTRTNASEPGFALLRLKVENNSSIYPVEVLLNLGQNPMQGQLK